MTRDLLKIYNSLNRRKELFAPQEEGKVSLYVCGVTPYDAAHVGHGRCYVHFDVVQRLLRFLGYDVVYVRNITDVDDKIIQKAGSNDLKAIAQVADKHFKAFEKDMEKLNVQVPCKQPSVSKGIDQIIELISTLLEKGAAYKVANDVYFDISSYASYGALSGKKVDELIAGARIEVRSVKKHEGDFALWKGNDTQDFWQAPWGGYGRPGWHIECSSFIQSELGETIDIHGGGIDLIFPHHENERAQSESATGASLVKYWMHNAHVTLHKEKMSKSSGNFFTLADVFETFDPMVVRFYLLQHHYRTPLDFSYDSLKASEKAYKKLIKVFHAQKDQRMLYKDIASDDRYAPYLDALLDDFNTPKFLGLLFAQLSSIQSCVEQKSVLAALLRIVLGLSCHEFSSTKAIGLTDEVRELIARRDKARQEKRWEEADALREQLHALGYKAVDKK